MSLAQKQQGLASLGGSPALPGRLEEFDGSEAQVIGYIKGKSTIHVARTFFDHKRNFVGQHFSVRGAFVSTVGRDEAAIREYIRTQEQEDRRQDQLKLV